MMFHLVAHARLAVEGQEHQPEHVERGHQRGGVTDQPQQAIGAAFGRPGLPQNFVFREKSGEGRDAGDGEGRDEHRPVGDWDAPVQVAHVAHVLLAAHGVNHRARAEEQQGLEESVREDVEYAGGECAHAERQEHVSQLRHGGIGQHALDVVLHQADGGREDRGQRADECHRLHRSRAPAQTAHSTAPPCTRRR